MSRKSVLLATLPLLLGACVSLPERKPVQIYSPQWENAAITPAPVDWQLIVNRPLAESALDSDRIAVRPRANALQAMAGARWSAPAPDLVGDAVLRAFQDAAALRAIGRAGDPLRADAVLQLDLRAFEADYTTARPQARVVVYASLIDARTRQVRASRLFAYAPEAGDGDADAVVAAFASALAAFSAEVRDWTLGHAGSQSE